MTKRKVKESKESKFTEQLPEEPEGRFYVCGEKFTNIIGSRFPIEQVKKYMKKFKVDEQEARSCLAEKEHFDQTANEMIARAIKEIPHTATTNMKRIPFKVIFAKIDELNKLDKKGKK